MSRVQQVVLIILVPVVVVGALFIGRASSGDGETGGVQVADAADVTVFEHDYTIPAGTPFESLSDDWICPVCGAPKSEFTVEE